MQSQGYTADETEETLQVSDAQMLSSHVINETRFQFIRDSTTNSANQAGAAINVLGEFTGGGNVYGQSADTISRYELQNYTSWAVGKHFVKFGGRLRASSDNSYSVANGNGTLTYSETDAASGTVSPLANYLQGTPSQLSIVNLMPGKDPRIVLSFADVGVYAEDDWKLRPNLTLSYGLRFESQSSINDKADFAPRLGLSWGLGSAKSAPKTVLRLGYGIFYDRFTEDLVLQAERLNGDVEQQTIYTATPNAPITCPAGTYPPSALVAANCNTTGVPNSLTLYQINSNLHAPYTMQSAVSVERQLGKVGTVSVTYLNSRGIHQLNLENANAPDALGLRPLSAAHGDDNIYQYNSEAIFKQNQLITNVQIRLSQKLSVTSFYALGYANSDTGGPSSNPSNQYDLTQDYGRAAFDVRNRMFLSGTASLAHNIRISPFVIANSGAPFNITTGQDNNGDSFFNDRPSYATNPICVGAQSTGCDAATNVKSTQYGALNVAPTAGERLVPINYGKGSANVTVNMRVSKTFGFGGEAAGSNSPSQSQGAGGGGRGGPGGGFGGPRGLANVFGPASTSRRYNLTLTMTGRNIFNTWNPGLPIGNLASTMFGKTDSLAGGPFSSGSANRRVDFQAMFAF